MKQPSIMPKFCALFFLITTYSLASTLDTIELINGDFLSGEVVDTNNEGDVEFAYPEASNPIAIKQDAIKKISFAKPTLEKKHLPEQIMLKNNDNFPCKLLSIDKDNVSFSTNYMGDHTIPRSAVKRIFFNNKPQNILFSGPKNDLSNWKTSDDNWLLRDGVLHSTKKSQIHTTIPKLPNDFVLEFRLKWSGETPRMKVYFCAESTDINKKLDNYYLDISSMELRITHYHNRRYRTLGVKNIDRKLYAESEGLFTLYVNRSEKKIYLYYNKKKIKEYRDIATPPKGAGLLFHALQLTNENVSISDIKVTSWNNHLIHSDDELRNQLTNNDLITDTNGQPIAGKLSNLDLTSPQPAATFSIPYAEKTSSIPVKKILYIDLQNTADNMKKEAEDQLEKRSLTFYAGGGLSFNSAILKPNLITVNHAILGELTLSKDAVTEYKLKEDK